MRTRRGFTLIELLVAMVVFVIVLGGALNFLRAQQRMFLKGADAMAVLQNLTFGADNLHHQIRTAGGNAPDAQPPVVYAAPSTFAFNADYVSNDPNSFGAVYIDPDAPASEVEAMRLSGQIVIPGSSPNFIYPTTEYLDKGINSQAETITLYFTGNSETARSDDFVLMRQVNNNPAEVLIRNVIRDSTNLPFFRYFRLRPPAANRLPQLIEVPAASMPMSHPIGLHGLSSDTAASAQIDSLRSVLVSFKVTNGETGTKERTERISFNIPLPNMGLRSLKICGSEPILNAALAAAYDPVGGDKVNLTWARALDENMGEKDVIRYVLWRRKLAPGPAEAYTDPLTSIAAAGLATYLHVDSEVESGTYEYRLAAQDCSPKLSPTVTSTVIIP